MWEKAIFNGVPPSARAAQSSDAVHRNIVVFGGWNGKKPLNDIFVYNIATNTWYECPSLPNSPNPRNNHATAVADGRIYVHGGHDGDRWLSDMFVLDASILAVEPFDPSKLTQMTWQRLEPSGFVPMSRACHSLSRVGRKLYLFGGYDGSRCFNDMDVFDLDTLRWSQTSVSGSIPLARNAHSVTTIGRKLLLFGGHSGSKHLSDVYYFDTANLHWSQPKSSGGSAPSLRGHSATIVGNYLVIFGGYDGKARSNSVRFFDLENLQWDLGGESDSLIKPIGRQRHAAMLVSPRKILIFGGFDGHNWLDDSFLLAPIFHKGPGDRSLAGLSNDLQSLVNNPASFPDVNFVVEGKKIPAHRGILCARSLHFRAMFTSEMAESQSGAEILMPNWSAEAFTEMLEYVYSSRVNFDSKIHLELLALADQLGIQGLKEECEIRLMYEIENANVCELLIIADRYSALNLSQKCLGHVLDNFDEVSKSLEFEQLPAQLLVEIARAGNRTSSK